MKLSELKANVYSLAEVQTTQQLKVKYADLKALDMRRKVSWEKALTVIQQERSELQDWLENPPEEYKELFADIQSVSAEYDRKLSEAKRLGQEVKSMARSLEQLAEECQDEADRLKHEVKAARRIAKQAHLN